MRKQLKWFTLALAAQLAACGGAPAPGGSAPQDATPEASAPEGTTPETSTPPAPTPEESTPAPEESSPDAPGMAEAAAVGTLTIFGDSLASGWVDWSWATHSLTATRPVNSGSRSITANYAPWTGIYFHHNNGLSTAGYEFLEFQVHGGTTTNPALTAYATVAAQARPTVQVNRYCDGASIKANAWTRCRVPLTALGVSNVTVDGFAVQEGAGRTLPVMAFDGVRLIPSATAPAPVPVVSVAVTPTSASLAAGATRTFTAAVSGSTNTGVLWSVQEGSAGGTITNAGLYTAPRTAGTYHVVATSMADGTKKATATVTVTAPTPTPTPSAGKWVSGYYTGWNADLYPPEKVDFSAMTHIIVGRVTPRTDGTVSTAFDNSNGPAMARTLTTRAHAAGRKAIMMVGGAGEHANWVGAASSANRAKFVQNLLNAMDSLGFDGIDVDWEPVEAADKPNLLALVKELRAARPNMLLTFPIGWINSNMASDVDPWYANLAPYLDQINIMSYEMIGPWDGWQSWYTSALYGEAGNRPTSVSASLNGWVSAGIPKAKLGMGIPFYGMAWRNITGPYQGFTNWSDFVGSDNSFTYKKIQQLSASGTYHWDAVAGASYLTFSRGVEDGTVRWISYDSPQTIAAKGAYTKDNGFGGTIIWTINQGCTDPATGANPLLDAVKSAFLQ